MSRWRWSVLGEERRDSPGAMGHLYGDSGEVEAELAGEVVSWLANGPGTPIWDSLDTDHPFTITIEPA